MGKKIDWGELVLGEGCGWIFGRSFFLFEHMLFLCVFFVGIPGMFLDAVRQNHINPAHNKTYFSTPATGGRNGRMPGAL